MKDNGHGMSALKPTMFAAGLLFLSLIAGCTEGHAVNNEASTSAIRSAEETGAAEVADASYFLKLAKAELAEAGKLAAKGDEEEAESMLLRAQVDAELAMVLSLQDTDKKDSARAIQRFQQSRDDPQRFQKKR